jgi:hypothetical protein
MIPFGPTNYVLGSATSVSFYRYSMGTIAIVVKCALYCFIGASLLTFTKKNSDDVSSTEVAIMTLIIISSIFLTVGISLKAKEVLDQKLKDKEMSDIEL